ncbi:MAG: hypothetical protein AVDCRST_MAG27-2936, partial [uncultured Craurococcus sp.]
AGRGRGAGARLPHRAAGAAAGLRRALRGEALPRRHRPQQCGELARPRARSGPPCLRRADRGALCPPRPALPLPPDAARPARARAAAHRTRLCGGRGDHRPCRPPAGGARPRHPLPRRARARLDGGGGDRRVPDRGPPRREAPIAGAAGDSRRLVPPAGGRGGCRLPLRRGGRPLVRHLRPGDPPGIPPPRPRRAAGPRRRALGRGPRRHPPLGPGGVGQRRLPRPAAPRRAGGGLSLPLSHPPAQRAL